MKNDKSCERTFIIVKPDGVQRGNIGNIIGRFEAKGLKVIGLKMLQISQDQAQRQYAVHKERPFYGALVKFMTSGPSVAMVVCGRNAIKLARKIMGATDALQAEPGTIRGDYSVDVEHNLVHGSDSPESYQHEMSVYFTPAELVSYELAVKSWL